MKLLFMHINLIVLSMAKMCQKFLWKNVTKGLVNWKFCEVLNRICLFFVDIAQYFN